MASSSSFGGENDMGRRGARRDDSDKTKPRVSSLRQIAELANCKDNEKGDEGPSYSTNNTDDDGEFVFTDEVHGQQEFELFSKSLANFGLVDSDLVEQVLEDQKELRRSKRASITAPSIHEISTDPRLGGAENKAALLGVSEDEDAGAVDGDSTLVAYHEGQKAAFLAVLDEVDRIAQSQARNGLRNANFTFGLMNCLLVGYIFGAHPEHFWIVYALETVVWMSFKFVRMMRAKPLSEVLYYLDFCWVMNALAIVVLSLLILVGDHMSTSFRKELHLAAFGIYCGPVFLAAMTLPFVAFLFHDVNTMANLIIHLMPSMQMYVVRWHAAAMYTTWPSMFRFLHWMNQELGGSTSPLIETDAINKHFPFWKGFREPSVSVVELEEVLVSSFLSLSISPIYGGLLNGLLPFLLPGRSQCACRLLWLVDSIYDLDAIRWIEVARQIEGSNSTSSQV
jgi:Protein of unknown function (DUF2838)